ncbi:UNVERIFIED_CONTAM: hypothetical protein Scaly_0679500 [Sesamum calycinum]|uniref:DDE Tnp4 domain-containing protein n=1 Tax=Sesamum calycinum TaxID=2727403 RepID=A0AAW2R6Q6_9LAMI
MHYIMLAKPTPITNECEDPRWRWFKGCLGALDGTFVDVRVPKHEKDRYHTRKGKVSVNILGVCNPKLQFIYVLCGWEGSAADNRVFQDSIHTPGGLGVLAGNYYLCNNANMEGFLTPYRDIWYHIPQLEAQMKRAFPHSHIKAEPYITSKLHMWKKHYLTLVTMTTKSGLGWDKSRQMVTVEDDKAWDEFVEPIVDQECCVPTAEWNLETDFNGDDEQPPHSFNMNCDPTVNSSSATKRTPSSRKRKVTDTCPEIPQLFNMVSNFCEIANNRLGSLTLVLENEFGDSDKCGLVMATVREISGLQENDILVVTSKLAHEPKDMDIFFNLTRESKEKMIPSCLITNLSQPSPVSVTFLYPVGSFIPRKSTIVQYALEGFVTHAQLVELLQTGFFLQFPQAPTVETVMLSYARTSQAVDDESALLHDSGVILLAVVIMALRLPTARETFPLPTFPFQFGFLFLI